VAQPRFQIEAAGAHMDGAQQPHVGAGSLDLGRDGQVPLQVQPVRLALQGLDQSGDAPGFILIGPAPPLRNPPAAHEAAALQGIHQGLGVGIGKQVQPQLGEGVLTQPPGAGQGLLPVGMGERHEMEGEEFHDRS